MLWWKVCAIPALPCKLAAVVIHRMLVQGRCAIPALYAQAAVVIHRMLWWKKGVRCHKLAAVVIHRMLWWKEGCAILRCHASSLSSHRMLWWKKVCYPALHASSLLL
jgi:hypothetical protein